MQNLSTEYQTIDSSINAAGPSVLKEPLKVNRNLLCPQCLKRVPLIEKISLSRKVDPLIRLKCQCISSQNDCNFGLNDYMNFLSKQIASSLCFKHLDQAATVFCKNCSLYLCQICYSYHYAFMPSHDIQLIYCGKDNDGCLFHMNQRLDLYCEDCNENICIECGKGRHFNHSVIQLREYWEKVKDKMGILSINELNARFENQMTTFNSMIQSQLKSIQDLISNLQHLKEKIEIGAKKATQANKLIISFACVLHSNFYQLPKNKTPSFAVIQNFERIHFEEFDMKKDEGGVFDIFNQMSELINLLNQCTRDTLLKTVIKIKGKNMKLKTPNVNTNGNVNKKGNKEAVFPIKIHCQPFKKQESNAEQSQGKELTSSSNDNEIKKICFQLPQFNSKDKNGFNSLRNNSISTNPFERAPSFIKEDQKFGAIVHKEDILKQLDIFTDKKSNTNSNSNSIGKDKDSIINSIANGQDSHFEDKQSETISYYNDIINQTKYLNKKKPRSKFKAKPPKNEKTKSELMITDEEQAPNDDLIIKLPLSILDQKKAINPSSIKEPKKTNGQIESNNNKQITNNDHTNVNNNNHNACSTILTPMNLMPSFDFETNKHSSPILLFNKDYDSLSNILGDDNHSQRASQDFDLDKDFGFFNQIFSKPNDQSKTLSPQEDSKQFEYVLTLNTFENCIYTIKEHKDKGAINILSQLKNGLLVSGGADNVINFYDCDNGYEFVSDLLTNNNTIISLIELSNGSIAVGCIDNTIKMYDLVNKKCVMILIGHSKPVTSIAQRDNEIIMTASEDRTIKMWSLQSNTCLSTFEEHYQSVTGLLIFNETTFISSSNDLTLKIWSFSDNRSLHTIKAHRGPITNIIKINETQIASASFDKTVKIWEVDSQRCIGTLIGHSDRVTSIIILNDCTLASASFDCSIRLWDINKMNCKKSIVASSNKINAIIQLANGCIASTDDDELIKIWK